MENQNNVTEFVFLGLWENKPIELLFCFLFLLYYLAVLMGNFIILLSITCTHLIKQPMYYFRCPLSILELGCTSTVVPRLIRDLAAEQKNISFNDCMTLLFTLHLLGSAEILILVSMALDFYVAIVKPLHYMVIMNRQRCSTLVMVAWGMGFGHTITLLLLTLSLPFCGPNEINHYVCDVEPILKLVCKDIHVINILSTVNSGVVVVVVFLVFLASYILALYSLRAYSTAGQCKALSTCSSHVMVVVLVSVPRTYIYILPAGSEYKDKEISLFYTVIAPC